MQGFRPEYYKIHDSFFTAVPAKRDAATAMVQKDLKQKVQDSFKDLENDEALSNI